MSRACRGRLGGAVPWGLGSGRVARTHDSTRCDLRFAWQVWDFGCIDAPRDGTGRWIRVAGVGKRAFWTLPACAFHVARVGQGGHRRCCEGGFAWQAWGMVRAVASLGIVLRGRRRESCAVAKIAGFRGHLCDKSRVRARVRVLGVAKSWQAQGIRGFVE